MTTENWTIYVKRLTLTSEMITSADRYFPCIASVGGLIIGVENRDANTNVKFHQKTRLSASSPALKSSQKALYATSPARTLGWTHLPFSYLKEKTVISLT